MNAIYTKNAPEPVSGDTLYCSGQIGINPKNGNLEEGIDKQTYQVMSNIDAVLKEAGFGFEDVVKTTCFLNDMNDFATFNVIYSKYFVSSPARSCVQAKLPKGALVEVEVIATRAE